MRQRNHPSKSDPIKRVGHFSEPLPMDAHLFRIVIWLVVYTYPSEKYEFVSWDDSSQLNGNIKKYSKPPTSYGEFGSEELF